MLTDHVAMKETQSSEFEEDAHHSMHWATDTEDLYPTSFIWGFPKIRGTLFWVLIVRILLFRILY